ncbi:FtsK/SpoIIIE domain-containing protein [Actinoplanes sp. NPDC049265]|uniref:FtsK/SpoIIIE domain-containing protein n=1 Tax=Actinoplanes sp. NPDC049265 TaxID=3363902 RepID=UPI003716578F
MILRLTVQDSATGEAHDAEVSAEPESVVGPLLAALPIRVGDRPCFTGGRPLDPRVSIADSPLVAGAVISVGAPGPDTDAMIPVYAGALRVLSGPDAGTTAHFTPGRHEVRRGTTGTAVLRDPEMSRRHAQLDVAPDGRAAVVDLGSTNGTLVEGRNATAPVPLAAGQTVEMGDTVLRWEPAPPPDDRRPVGRRSRDGLIYFDRAFAPAPAIVAARITLPEDETTPRNLATVIVSAVVPVALGVVMAMVTRQPSMLMIALFGPVTAVAAYLVERHQRRSRQRDFAGRKAAAEREIAAAVEREEALRRGLAPAPGELEAIAAGTRRGLWPRNAGAADGLTLRVGTTDEPATVDLQGRPWPGFATPTLRGVPATVDLRATGVLGVAGPREHADALVRWLLLQLATLRSPDDLRLVVVTARDDDTLGWTRWLPHLDAGDAIDTPCWIGNTAATRAARVKELSELVEARRRENGSQPARYSEEVVVVLDGALALRHLPGMRDVLRDGPSAGVYVICVDRNDMNECHGVCRIDDAATMSLNRDRADHDRPVRPEGVDAATVSRLARALTPMRDRLTLAAAQTAIPFPVRQADLYDVDIRTPDGVASLWRRVPGPSMAAVIGADASGPVVVDLAEQGTHAMLGGTTGAGKSVLLQTLVTALLLANTPEELNLVLVDFKGGSAFLPFQNCPHVVGLIRSTGATAADVFDQAAADRVIRSVRAETNRREAALAPFGGEIDEYWKARRANPAMPPLPRLVLIFDEYARVLDTAPDFVKELVAVTAKGRALGEHLVLATQSLAGKVPEEMKNNISIRITLRQNDAVQSTEVLGIPDAADIPRRLRGRGIVNIVGGESGPRAFQSGYLGDSPVAGGAPPATVRTVDWPAAGLPRPEQRAEASDAPTDLQLAVRAIESAAARAGLVAPFRPLHPPLPAALTLDDLPPAEATGAPYGLVDEPSQQAQPPAVVDLAGPDRLMVAGGPQSGRTTFARALIESLAGRFGPDRLHLYVFEQTPAGLDTFAELPQCGGVFSPADRDRVRRLITWLDGEVQRRATARFLPERDREPAIVLVVDGWEHFENRGDPNFVETGLLGLLRGVVTAGPPLGVHVVAIGGQAMLNGKAANDYSRRLLLPFPKEETRRSHLAGGVASPPRVPGRAIDAATGVHVQIALPSPSFRPAAGSGAPRRFAPLPSEVPLGQLPAAEGMTIGVGGPDVAPIAVDLFGGGSNLMMISGPAGSGRSTAAATVAAALAAQDIPVLVIGPRPAVAAGGPVRVLTGAVFADADLREAVKDVADGRFAVVVDDFHQVTVSPSQEGYTDLPTLLDDLIGPMALGRQALVLCGDATPVLDGTKPRLGRLVSEVMNGTRLLLTPMNPHTARMHGFTLDPDQFFAGPPGRGHLAVGSQVRVIQLGRLSARA